MIKVTEEEIARLSKTGWQSWSYPSKLGDLLKLPMFNYAPGYIEDYTHLDIQYSSTLKKPAKGWCSWYAFSSGLNRDNILRQVKWLKDQSIKDFEYILIDGGWCREGDWLNENYWKFPDGMRGMASEIKKNGFKPGIWMSPFQANPKSKVFKENPSWFVRSKGSFADGLKITHLDYLMPYTKYHLDIRRTEVRDHLKRVIDTLLGDYGYQLIKLDFLYSIYFIPGISNYEADKYLREYFKYIKDKYPHVYTIACGCPLIPAIGLVDSMRVGPDTILSPFFKFSRKARILDAFILPRVKRTIENRLWTSKYWNIDPDAFVCRPQLGLSQKHVESFLEIIKQSKGNIFLGDDLTKLSKERVDKYILPLTKF